MAQPHTQPVKGLNRALWVVQVLLAACMLWGAGTKLLLPADKLAAMWPWTAQVSPALLTFTAITDLLGALGLVLPMLMRVKPRLTHFAALGIVVLMIAASAFHISRGEGGLIVPNVVFALMAGFVAWGRR